jgi:hypothetical protein
MYGQTAQQPVAEKEPGAKPPRRRGDPFRALDKDVDHGMNYLASEMTREPSMSDQLASLGVQRPQLYQTMRAERELEEFVTDALTGRTDLGDPPMRMAGIITGRRIFGILEVNGQSQLVRPGQTIGQYRVERVEPEKIVLSRPTTGGKRRTVDVPLLAGNPAFQQQFPGGAPGGFPGDPGLPGSGGFPGGPGGGPASAR